MTRYGEVTLPVEPIADLLDRIVRQGIMTIHTIAQATGLDEASIRQIRRRRYPHVEMRVADIIASRCDRTLGELYPHHYQEDQPTHGTSTEDAIPAIRSQARRLMDPRAAR